MVFNTLWRLQTCRWRHLSVSRVTQNPAGQSGAIALGLMQISSCSYKKKRGLLGFSCFVFLFGCCRRKGEMKGFTWERLSLSQRREMKIHFTKCICDTLQKYLINYSHNKEGGSRFPPSPPVVLVLTVFFRRGGSDFCHCVFVWPQQKCTGQFWWGFRGYLLRFLFLFLFKKNKIIIIIIRYF